MRWLVFAATAAIAAVLWLPGEAAQPAPPASAADAISFAQYRDWRDQFMARRRDEIAAQLAEPGLSAERKARLERAKAYYDDLAALSPAERERLYRRRFALIDTNHDGTMDTAERAAWRDKRRVFYRSHAPRDEAAAAH